CPIRSTPAPAVSSDTRRAPASRARAAGRRPGRQWQWTERSDRRWSGKGASYRDVGGRLRGGGVGRLRDAERQQERSEPHAIAVVQPDSRRDPAIADERPVLAAEVLDPRVVIEVDTRVPTRDGGGRQFDDVCVAAAEQVLAVEDLHALIVPDQ